MNAVEGPKEIGGYFGLEFGRNTVLPHENAIALNSARNGFLYVLLANRPAKVFLPCFICDSMLQTLVSAGVPYEFSSINDRMEFVQPIHLGNAERLLAVNYFGLKSAYCERLAKQYGPSLFIDNSQAFYAAPVAGCDTVYSPRKFFGVSDGGYLYTESRLSRPLEHDTSHEAVLHLAGRADGNAAGFYQDYRKSEERLAAKPLRRMSRLTRTILGSIDYELAGRTRERNFLFLHNALGPFNKMNVTVESLRGPLAYPFLTGDEQLRDRLIRKNIYVPTYWREVLDRPCSSQVEKKLVVRLLPLPVDQRYGLEEMQAIVDAVLS